jgi:hypothetical protein
MSKTEDAGNTTSDDVAAVFREGKSPAGRKGSIGRWIFVGLVALAIYNILQENDRKHRAEQAEVDAKYEIAKADAERRFQESDLGIEMEGLKLRAAEVDSQVEVSQIVVGATVRDWRNASSRAQMLIVESWVRTALSARSDEVGDSGVSLIAVKVSGCINTAIADAAVADDSPVSDLGAACIASLGG